RGRRIERVDHIGGRAACCSVCCGCASRDHVERSVATLCVGGQRGRFDTASKGLAPADGATPGIQCGELVGERRGEQRVTGGEGLAQVLVQLSGPELAPVGDTPSLELALVDLHDGDPASEDELRADEIELAEVDVLQLAPI